MTSRYSPVIILVLFKWIIKQDYKKKYLVTEDWSQYNTRLCYHENEPNQKHICCYVQHELIETIDVIKHTLYLLLLNAFPKTNYM